MPRLIHFSSHSLPGHRPRSTRPSGSTALWWSGGHHLAIDRRDGRFAIGTEADNPAVVVNLLMVLLADGQQIREISTAVVSPPDHVMQLGTGVAHAAARDRTGRVQSAQRTPLIAVRQACGATQIHDARGFDHEAVSDFDRVHAGDRSQRFQELVREVDVDSPVEARPAVG